MRGLLRESARRLPIDRNSEVVFRVAGADAVVFKGTAMGAILSDGRVAVKRDERYACEA
jgi:hypothetical protein